MIDEAAKHLAAQWRSEAAVLRRRGAEDQAKLLESCADDLVEFAAQWGLEALTLKKAAEESEHSRSGLDKMISRGLLENVGKEGSPRVLRGDLPRKPGRRRARRATLGAPDLAGDILAARGG